MSAGSRGVSRYLVALWRQDGAGSTGPRLGIVASRKVGGAVRRSRAKRLLREVYRRDAERPAGDLVLIARRGIHEAAWPDLVRAYRSARRMAAGNARSRSGSPQPGARHARPEDAGAVSR
jgi:ribonuclease P protein component